MRTDVRLLDGVLRIAVNGPADYEDCDRLLRRLAAGLRDRSGPPVLIDARGIEYLPSTAETRTLAELMIARSDSIRAPIAIVTEPGAIYGMGRLFTIRASLAGVPVEAFTDLEEAVAWLRPRDASTV